MFHPFLQDIRSHLPIKEFNNPFHYQPHPLCVIAAESVQKYLESRTDWNEEWKKGKMFGVLIVENEEGETGFLAAFSGILAGNYLHEYFVPPIYNLQLASGFFKPEEEQISKINQSIHLLETSDEYLKSLADMESLEREANYALDEFKRHMKEAKKRRDLKRKENVLTEEEQNILVKESQFQKAEFKRQETHWAKRLAKQQLKIDHFNQQLSAWKEERKKRSAELQERLFEQFRLLNARGEEKDLTDIFLSFNGLTPPAGAGECAAPKLLQYAYKNKLRPLAIAEFWWGNSPGSSIRHQGQYYPSCKSKCEPILKHMLEGLDIDKGNTTSSAHCTDTLKYIYEDEHLLIVDKPSGMLSVPGKEDKTSVFSIISGRYPKATGPLMVHRLDMDTSGLLVIAKSKEIHAQLQHLFENRDIKKRYTALLQGTLPKHINPSGLIKLPIRPDYDNRPYQMADPIYGKTAVTRYVTQGTSVHTFANGEKEECTRILLYPLTGRTHQLRVHMAHSSGLNTPIIGDTLYGKPDKRLYLHACYLEFKHPVTGKTIKATSPAPF